MISNEETNQAYCTAPEHSNNCTITVDCNTQTHKQTDKQTDRQTDTLHYYNIIQQSTRTSAAFKLEPQTTITNTTC